MDSNHYHHWYKIQKTFFLTSTSLDDFGPPPSSHLSIMKHHPNCGFKPLNQYQEEAVKDALGKPFTLVQGPPGKHDNNPYLTYSSISKRYALDKCPGNKSDSLLWMFATLTDLNKLVSICNLRSSGLNLVQIVHKSRFLDSSYNYVISRI